MFSLRFVRSFVCLQDTQKIYDSHTVAHGPMKKKRLELGGNPDNVWVRVRVGSVVVWCSGNALVLINAVALHRARLELGWLTAVG